MSLIERPQTLAEFIVNDIEDVLNDIDIYHVTGKKYEELAIELTTVVQRRLIQWSRDAREETTEYER